jgi:hypothetical protein
MSLPFWDVLWGRLVICYRRFGTAYRLHVQGWKKKKEEKKKK